MVSRSFRELSRARADRARQLAGKLPAARDPLLFFAEVADFQAEAVPEGIGWNELGSLRGEVQALLARIGTPPMREVSREIPADHFESLLLDCRQGRKTEGLEILPARILLQPLAFRQPATPGVPPPGPAACGCPRCFHAPQAGILREAGHGRALTLCCSLCLHEWPASRNRCTSCGREGREVLEYCSSEEFPGRILQACQSCRRYIHLIDLAAEPAAVADADEVAAVVLDVWARDQGLIKQQQNLAGI